MMNYEVDGVVRSLAAGEAGKTGRCQGFCERYA
jgi:hypothetical protein